MERMQNQLNRLEQREAAPAAVAPAPQAQEQPRCRQLAPPVQAAPVRQPAPAAPAPIAPPVAQQPAAPVQAPAPLSAAEQQVNLYISTLQAMCSKPKPPALDTLLAQMDLLNDTARGCNHPLTEKVNSILSLMRAREHMGAQALAELFITYLGTAAQREFLTSVNAFDKRQNKKAKEGTAKSNSSASQRQQFRSPLNPANLPSYYRNLTTPQHHRYPTPPPLRPQNGGTPRNPNAPLRCYLCGSSAHLKRMCPHNRR